MDGIDVVERGYRAVMDGDGRALGEVFTDDVVWNLMNRSEVARSYQGRQAVVDFLLGFRELRLEAIMANEDSVVAAHSFLRRDQRAIATTVYRFRNGLVSKTNCSDVMRPV